MSNVVRHRRRGTVRRSPAAARGSCAAARSVHLRHPDVHENDIGMWSGWPRRPSSRPASPTTSMSLCAFNSAANPARTMVWSSTMITRMVARAAFLYAEGDRARSARRAATRNPPSGGGPTSSVPPTNRTRSLITTSPHVPCHLTRSGDSGSVAGPLTTIDRQQGAVVERDRDVSARAPERVPHHVRQRLLHDAVRRQSPLRRWHVPQFAHQRELRERQVGGHACRIVASDQLLADQQAAAGTRSPWASSLAQHRDAVPRSRQRAARCAPAAMDSSTSTGRIGQTLQPAYGAESACAVITDMWWATTSCNSCGRSWPAPPVKRAAGALGGLVLIVFPARRACGGSRRARAPARPGAARRRSGTRWGARPCRDC